LANLEGLDRRVFFSKISKTARGQTEVCPFLFCVIPKEFIMDKFVFVIIGILFLVCESKANEDDSMDSPEPIPVSPPVPVLASALPAPVISVAQALGNTSLSKGCVEDFTNVLGKSGFSMTSFAKELVPAVTKTKLQLKAPFGKPKDSDMTSAGLTVGCIKTLPESPAGIQSLLKDISLKAGLSFVESPIPTNIDTGSDSGGGTFKTVMSISLISGGLGTLVYGFMQNGEIKDSVSKGKAKTAVDAEKSRNISYGIGAGLLASGLVITVFF
jgi:hypothetical protein